MTVLGLNVYVFIGNDVLPLSTAVAPFPINALGPAALTPPFGTGIAAPGAKVKREICQSTGPLDVGPAFVIAPIALTVLPAVTAVALVEIDGANE